MGAMDKVSENIYVGSVWALSSPRDLKAANITHIVSLLRGDVTDMSSFGFKQLHIEIDDDDEEDIMRFFAQTNEFINTAIRQGGNVLVHCIAGISRSATIATAYLLTDIATAPPPETAATQNHDYHVAQKAQENEQLADLLVTKTIDRIKQGRPIVNPNDSFRSQLVIFLRSGCAVSLEKPLYRQWILAKRSEGIPLTGQPPKDINYVSASTGMLKLSSNDSSAPIPQSAPGPQVSPNPRARAELYARLQRAPHPFTQNPPDAQSTPTNAPIQPRLTQLRCKKCRTPLASSKAFILHTPPPNAPGLTTAPRNGLSIHSSLNRACMQYFMEPALWMKPELEKGALDGKFCCPKCNSRIGSYSWQGNKCSCGTWVTPAIELQRARVDEVVVRQPL